MAVMLPYCQAYENGGTCIPAPASPHTFYFSSLPLENTNMAYCPSNTTNNNVNNSPGELFSSPPSPSGPMQYSVYFTQPPVMLPPSAGSPNTSAGSIPRQLLTSGVGDTSSPQQNMICIPSGNGGMLLLPAPDGSSGTLPTTTTGGSGISDNGPYCNPIFVDGSPSSSRCSQPPLSISVTPTNRSYSAISANSSLNNTNACNSPQSPFGNSNGVGNATLWVAGPPPASNPSYFFPPGSNAIGTSPNAFLSGGQPGSAPYLKDASGSPVSDPSVQKADGQLQPHLTSPFSSDNWLLSRYQRAMTPIQQNVPLPLSPFKSTGGTGGRRGNVYTILEQKGLRYIPYNKVAQRNTTAEDARCAFLMTLPQIPVFFQMFPSELKERGETLNTILREVYPEFGVLGLVEQTFPRSETSFIAYIRTDIVYHLIKYTRVRILMDRFGCWYAENMEQYRELKAFCENIRRMPQHDRHAVTDGLPCMPLVVELSTLVQKESITAPSAGKCFDEIEPIQPVERNRPKS